MSTVQIRVIENVNKMTIAIHQEKLLSSGQRNEMKEYCSETMNKLIK